MFFSFPFALSYSLVPLPKVLYPLNPPDLPPLLHRHQILLFHDGLVLHYRMADYPHLNHLHYIQVIQVFSYIPHQNRHDHLYH